MSTIINGTDLTNYLIDYTPIFEPSFETKTAVNAKVKFSDYGQKYDVFKTRIALAMSVSEYEAFRTSLYEIEPTYDPGSYLYNISFSTSEQLFIPGQNITTGTCEFVSEKQLGFYDFKMNWSIYELVFAYSVPQIIAGDYTSYIQDSFNKAIKTPVDSKKMFSHQANYVSGGRFSQIRNNRFPKYEVDCYQDLVKPSDVNPLLNFYRINRSTPFQLNISNGNIFGWSGLADVMISNFNYERQQNGFYQVSYTITQR